MNTPVTPDTVGYLLMGLAMIAAIIGTYAGTLVYRLRQTQQTLDKLSIGR